jgi:N-acetylneuraminate synthase/N,N'-diacetyllegionaminate synthase
VNSGSSISIGKYRVGTGHPVFVIAEAGVNHNGDIQLARSLVRAAKQCGADCLKFQTFRSEEIVTAKAPKANYQLQSTNPSESQFDMLKALELPEEAFAELKQLCESEGILFLSTPYSFADADLLDRIGVEAFKIASGQLTEYPFLEYIAKKGKPLILSTGMSDLSDVRGAVETVRQAGNQQIVLLQCTTNYPSSPEDCHLRAMQTLASAFGVLTGYSDHTAGSLAVLASVARDACVIEKHFTIDRSLPGPDHACSIEPSEFASMVRDVRLVESMLGRAEKVASEAERRNAVGMKRSIASRRAIAKGTKIQPGMLAFKRPATGIPPKDLNKVIGAVALVDIPADTILTGDMLDIRTGTSHR